MGLLTFEGVPVSKLDELKERLKEEIKRHETRVEEWKKECAKSDSLYSLYNRPRDNRIKAVEAEIAFTERGIPYEEHSPGLYLLRGWMYYAPASGKWKAKRGLYWKKSPAKINTFITNHLHD